jgi:predicted site-specific integrase-resolvase
MFEDVIDDMAEALQIMTVEQVAQAKGILPRSVYLAVREGRLKPLNSTDGSTLYIFDKTEVERFLLRHAGRPRKAK